MDVALMWEALPDLLLGLLLTLQIVPISLAIGFAGGVAIALMRLSANPLLGWPAYAFVFVFRGTPLLVQIAMIYFGVGSLEVVRESFLWPVFREPFWCAIVALGLNSAAYASEIIRGGILSVPFGQVEAARACGMDRLQVFRRIVMPVALRQALPAYSNEIVLVVKASSLASTITLMDLTGVANEFIAVTFKPIPIFVVAGSIYLALNWFLTECLRLVDWRLTVHMRPRDGGDRPPALERLVGHIPVPVRRGTALAVGTVSLVVQRGLIGPVARVIGLFVATWRAATPAALGEPERRRVTAFAAGAVAIGLVVWAVIPGASGFAAFARESAMAVEALQCEVEPADDRGLVCILGDRSRFAMDRSGDGTVDRITFAFDRDDFERASQARRAMRRFERYVEARFADIGAVQVASPVPEDGFDGSVRLEGGGFVFQRTVTRSCSDGSDCGLEWSIRYAGPSPVEPAD